MKNKKGVQRVRVDGVSGQRDTKKEDRAMDLVLVPKLLFGITAVIVAVVLLVLKDK